jgi:hypothetical protein
LFVKGMLTGESSTVRDTVPPPSVLVHVPVKPVTADPPFDEGAENAIDTPVVDAVAEVIGGAVGTVRGVAVTAVESAPSVIALYASTWKLNATPFARPEAVQKVLVAPTAVQASVGPA